MPEFWLDGHTQIPVIDIWVCAFSLNSRGVGGARRDRTADLLRARQALSQLSYGPNNQSRVTSN